MNISKTKKLITIGMLCVLAYYAVVVGSIPLILFWKYDPKDIIIVIGGLVFGPITSFFIALIASLVEMVTISGTGILGCIMNIISSCSFACTAAFIYKRKHKLSGAILGLFCGLGCQVAVMMLGNYLIPQIYMGYPREINVEVLIRAFLSFSLIKGSMNVAMTIILYKPVVTALRRLKLIESKQDSDIWRVDIRGLLVALLMIITCVLLCY